MTSTLGIGDLTGAIRDTLTLFMEDAPEMEGRSLDVDPAPSSDGGIRLTVDGAEYHVTVQRERGQ